MVRLFCTFALLFSWCSLNAQARPPTGEPAEIHEAFVAPVPAMPLLNAILKQPPEPITERIPPNDDPEARWIPGYWAYIEKKGDFAWICGVWRKSPPGMVWNAGFWKKFPEGWVRIEGFWHNQPADNLTAQKERPPVPIDEKVQSPPGKDFFWAPGFWQFSNMSKKYAWVPGKWEKLDKDWVLNPGYYTWREEGYILVPPYWDYTLDQRGKAYCAQYIPEGNRSGYVHTPATPLQPDLIIGQIFPCWPDHICFFNHWWHFHPGFWNDWCCTPPWWGWDAWWGFGPLQMWDMWWWWSHPGFAFPWWMQGWVGGLIPPAGGIIIDIMFGFGGPIFIGPFGPFPLLDLLNAIDDANGNGHPILPADPVVREDILKKVPPRTSENGDKRPSGKPNGEEPEKPYTPPEGNVPRAPGGSSVPSKPSAPSMDRPIKTPQWQWQPKERPDSRPPIQSTPQNRPRPPQEYYPEQRPPQRYYPMPRPQPEYTPKPRPRPRRPYPWPQHNPDQGRPQDNEYPEYEPSRPSQNQGNKYPNTEPSRPSQNQGETFYPNTGSGKSHMQRFPNIQRRPQFRSETIDQIRNNQFQPQQTQPNSSNSIFK